MTEGYTKGPWRAVGKITAVAGDSLWCGHIQRKDDGAYRGRIADIQSADHVGGITREEARANARLIAASPDLLEALKGLVQINEQHNEAISKIIGHPLGWKDEYLTAARAAIAKAEGGAP